jgi:RNA polymerase sigma-70 factor (ECF subfamily)
MRWASVSARCPSASRGEVAISPPLSSSTSNSLLARARAHDADAWRRLAQLYAPVVYQWARRAGLQASDTLDVGQEVFRTVADRLGDFRTSGSGDSFRAWLWGITHNKLREHFRRRGESAQGAGGTDAHQRLQSLADAPPHETADIDIAAAHADVVQRAMQFLQSEFEPRTMQAFWQSAIDGRSTADIAADLRMTPKAVRQAKHRVLSRLRDELADLL